MRDFVEQKQTILKSMNDSVCFTREEAKLLEKALIELEQYQTIGTLQECRDAMAAVSISDK